MLTIPPHLLELLTTDRLIPVLTIDDPALALPLGEALARGGCRLAEVTLRTDGALDALQALVEADNGLLVGAGSLLTPAQAEDAAARGAAFGVSPGLVPSTARAAMDKGLFFIPGVVTPTEALKAVELGMRLIKFFPAAVAGGPAWLGAIATPLHKSRVQWIPTGGIDNDNLTAYLQTPGVIACGGSWLATPSLVRKKAWPKIEEQTRQALHQARMAGQGGNGS